MFYNHKKAINYLVASCALVTLCAYPADLAEKKAKAKRSSDQYSIGLSLKRISVQDDAFPKVVKGHLMRGLFASDAVWYRKNDHKEGLLEDFGDLLTSEEVGDNPEEGLEEVLDKQGQVPAREGDFNRYGLVARGSDLSDSDLSIDGDHVIFRSNWQGTKQEPVLKGIVLSEWIKRSVRSKGITTEIVYNAHDAGNLLILNEPVQNYCYRCLDKDSNPQVNYSQSPDGACVSALTLTLTKKDFATYRQEYCALLLKAASTPERKQIIRAREKLLSW